MINVARVAVEFAPASLRRLPSSAVFSLGLNYTRILIIACFLAGCASSPPVVVPEIIYKKTYIPAPSTLTLPVEVALLPGTTYGGGLGSLRAGLDTCNGRLEAIKTLKSPTPQSDKGSDKPPYKWVVGQFGYN